MLYETAENWLAAPRKRVLLLGMSGLGKTHISQRLRATGRWFHYSIDYRIGSRYLDEAIADNAKREAMKVPFLRDLLMTDSIHVTANLTFSNLAAVSSWLGKPGDPAKGGLPIAEYRARQARFRAAEIAALRDTGHFARRSEELYGYPNFVCDSGGSICEWVDPEDPEDPLLTELAQECLLVWIEGSRAHEQELIRRFDAAPKPMAYQPEFLTEAWTAYLEETGSAEAEVDPDSFIRFAYARALAHRQPRYAAMAKWGVTISAAEAGGVEDEAGFTQVIAAALERRALSAGDAGAR
ncbi:ATPase [Pseudoroseicyclus tamaricis]|uniref:ATPase n=1 Tax=Pseudoroseicyclus tamaricis TaxID=2705421 RepID=A0A6B2JVI1_9RHOB|nr:ATPase [Pseudoroseicyclus tamaricis]NDV00639.1 ATPase [Pseudoroseicyclus tamaricis]